MGCLSKKICSKDLRWRITIEQLVLSDDGQGGHSESWSTLATPWAKLEPLSASQIWHAQQLEHRVTHKITIRYRNDIESNMRILFEGRIFHIKSFRDLESQKRFTEIMAEEGAPS